MLARNSCDNFALILTCKKYFGLIARRD